jgi:ABC-type sulfate/molybdate transport systems ATPase subunit
MLLDEPFASLDAPLRRELSELVSGWLRKLGIASLFVTHDLNEALAIADRVALLREGRLVQCSTPQGLMNHPVDAWTATFSGHPNVYRGSMASRLPGAGSTRASGGDALLLAEACDWQPGGESSTGVRAICRRAELLRDGWRLTLEVPSWGVEVIWSARSRELPSEHQPPARDTEGVLIAPPHAWRSWPEVTQ